MLRKELMLMGGGENWWADTFAQYPNATHIIYCEHRPSENEDEYYLGFNHVKRSYIPLDYTFGKCYATGLDFSIHPSLVNFDLNPLCWLYRNPLLETYHIGFKYAREGITGTIYDLESGESSSLGYFTYDGEYIYMPCDTLSIQHGKILPLKIVLEVSTQSGGSA